MVAIMGFLTHHISDNNVVRYGNGVEIHSRIENGDDYYIANNGWLQPTAATKFRRGWICMFALMACIFCRFVLSHDMTLDSALSWNPNTAVVLYDHIIRNLAIAIFVVLLYITILQRLDIFGNSVVFRIINNCIMTLYYLIIALFTIIYLSVAISIVIDMIKSLFSNQHA